MGIPKDRLKNVLIWLLASMTMIVFIACGSSDDDDDDDDEVVTKITVSGYVMDGYGSGATVCIDTNNNNAIDADEPQTTTNSTGYWSITRNAGDPTGNIISQGGTDISTGQPLMSMSTPAPSTTENSTRVLSPGSTMVVNRMDTTGENAQTAENNVLAAINPNFSAFSNIGLTDYNYIEGSQSNDQSTANAAVTIANVSAQISNLITAAVTTAQGASSGTVDSTEVIGTIMGFLNSQINSTQSIDNILENSQSISQALSNVGDTLSSSQGGNFNLNSFTQTGNTLATVLAETNKQTTQAVQSSSGSLDALTTIAASSKVTENIAQTAAQVAQGTADQTALQAYDTTAIQNEIQQQAQNVDQSTVAPDVSNNPTTATGSAGGTGD